MKSISPCRISYSLSLSLSLFHIQLFFFMLLSFSRPPSPTLLPSIVLIQSYPFSIIPYQPTSQLSSQLQFRAFSNQIICSHLALSAFVLNSLPAAPLADYPQSVGFHVCHRKLVWQCLNPFAADVPPPRAAGSANTPRDCRSTRCRNNPARSISRIGPCHRSNKCENANLTLLIIHSLTLGRAPNLVVATLSSWMINF